MYSQPYVKIGITYDFPMRLRQLQTGSPERLIPLRLIEVSDEETAKKLEGIFHKRYASHKAHGEWFKIGAADVMSDINFALAITDYFGMKNVMDTDLEGGLGYPQYAYDSPVLLDGDYNPEYALTIKELMDVAKDAETTKPQPPVNRPRGEVYDPDKMPKRPPLPFRLKPPTGKSPEA
jgi:hypothetical protein